MKKATILILLCALFASCADAKFFEINGKTVKVEPYGWADSDELKNDSVVYKVNKGNVVWSVILCETVAVPVWLTGWQLYEPVHKKKGLNP